MGDFLLHMKSHPLYEEFEEVLMGHRPNIPSFRHADDNTDEWKYNSAQQEGFDLCLTLFKIGVQENDR